MPVHLAQINALEKDDPSTWETLKSFCCGKIRCSIQQEIKGLKRNGGMVRLTQDAVALDRLVTTTPHLTHIVKEYLNSFPSPSKATDRNEHYQLSRNITVRSRSKAVKLHLSMELHCAGNQFMVKSSLKSLVSSAIVPDNAKDMSNNFSGADWGGKFVDLTKKSWISACMKLDENDCVIGYFKMLGEGPLPNQLDNGELPPEVKGLEQLEQK